VCFIGVTCFIGVLVVRHTDNQGALEMNMDLSMRRANAVVEVLAGKYGVAPAGLKPLGDGPCARGRERCGGGPRQESAS
jgi:hypothetical protein